MKKVYSTPETTIVEIQCDNILAGSGGVTNGSSYNNRTTSDDEEDNQFCKGVGGSEVWDFGD